MKQITDRTNQYGKYKVWDIDRLLEFQKLLDREESFAEIGRHFGISGTRAKQIAVSKLGYKAKS